MNYIVSMMLFFIFLYIVLFKYRNSSEVGKAVLKKCEDPEIVQEFKNINITGLDFITKLLGNNNKFKIIIRNRSGNGACVHYNKIFMDQDFNNTLSLETFRDTLHEYRHVIDNRYCKLQNILVYIDFIDLLISIILFTLGLIIKLNNELIIFRIILVLTGTILCIICFGMNLTIENNAIRYVVIECKEKLIDFNFGENIINRIYSYLSLQAAYIAEWYTMQIVSSLMLFLSFFFIAL